MDWRRVGVVRPWEVLLSEVRKGLCPPLSVDTPCAAVPSQLYSVHCTAFGEFFSPTFTSNISAQSLYMAGLLSRTDSSWLRSIAARYASAACRCSSAARTMSPLARYSSALAACWCAYTN